MPTNMVSETYQIPAYDMYDQYWDVEHLRSRTLTIPFANDRLMLLLVQSSNHAFVMPCVYDEIFMHYGLTESGDFHTGIDLTVENQTLVKCCFDGVVRMAKNYGDYGKMVVIRHYNGLETIYAHLDKYSVRPGQIVNAGDIIGQTGETGHLGRAKTPILHFELRFMNEYFDPELAIDFENEAVVKNTLVLKSEDFTFTPINDLGGYIPEVKEPVHTESPVQTTEPTPNESQPTETDNSNNTTEPAQEVVPSENNLPTEQPSENIEYHIVKKGETLYRIALNHHTTVEMLIQLNNIKDIDNIKEGQKLRVK